MNPQFKNPERGRACLFGPFLFSLQKKHESWQSVPVDTRPGSFRRSQGLAPVSSLPCLQDLSRSTRISKIRVRSSIVENFMSIEPPRLVRLILTGAPSFLLSLSSAALTLGSVALRRAFLG